MDNIKVIDKEDGSAIIELDLKNEEVQYLIEYVLQKDKLTKKVNISELTDDEIQHYVEIAINTILMEEIGEVKNNE